MAMKSPVKLPRVGLTTVSIVVFGGMLLFNAAPEAIDKYHAVTAAISPASAANADDARTSKASSEPNLTPAAVTASTCWNRDAFAVLTDLTNQAKKTQSTNQNLEEERAALKAERKRLEDRISQLQNLKQDLQTRLDRRNEMAREDTQRLVEIYASMRAAKAAKVMRRHSLQAAADIIERMDTQDAADIFSQMDPENASRLTRELNRRREMVQGREPVQNTDNS